MIRRAIIFGMISFHALANNPGLNDEFKTAVSKSKLGGLKEQSFCYFKDSSVQGFQVNKVQRIASITKLFTSLLAAETINLNRTFITKLYIGKDTLYIEGERDPYFEEEKLLLMFQALNELGHKNFKRVVFNRDFLFYDLGLNKFAKITPEITQKRLSFYLNPKNTKAIRAKWAAVRAFAKEENVDLEIESPFVTTQSVVISDKNPLLNENPLVYRHESKPLHAIMKTMNVQSKNLVAENLYNMASKIKKFSLLMSQYGISAGSYRIFNGSGLPLINGKQRLDNLASCALVLKVVNNLSASIKRYGLELSDIVAVNGGKDFGSFRSRFKDLEDTHESVISKTGTLKNASTIGGVLLNIDGQIPFAVLNHTSRLNPARKMQDNFISLMLNSFGQAAPVNYEKISIFPWGNGDFLIQM